MIRGTRYRSTLEDRLSNYIIDLKSLYSKLGKLLVGLESLYSKLSKLLIGLKSLYFKLAKLNSLSRLSFIYIIKTLTYLRSPYI